MFKVNNKDTRTMLLASFWCFGVFIVNFEHISHLIRLFLLFEHVIVGSAGICEFLIWSSLETDFWQDIIIFVFSNSLKLHLHFGKKNPWVKTLTSAIFLKLITLIAQKRSFSLRIPSINATKFGVSCEFGHIY